MPKPPTVDNLKALLETNRAALERIEGLIGCGIGISPEGQPTIQIFVSPAASKQILSELDRLLGGNFLIVHQADLPDAQSQGSPGGITHGPPD
jgi:hypothetical protein